MSKRFDVLGLGCAAVDDILYVDHYPPADAKVHALRRERYCGGLTATALVAAARLGAKAAFAGTLGFDEGSEFVLETLRREGVDVKHSILRKDAGPVRSVIIVDEKRQTRNVFAHLENVRGAHPTLPKRSIIEVSRVLLIDYFGTVGNIRAARMARRAGIPVVSDLERANSRRFGELLALIDHPILSSRAATLVCGEGHPGRAAAKIWNRNRAVVIVTCGAEGAWFVSAEQRQPRHVPAFPVNVTDTTGCGDVFHGAYAAALAKGMNVEQRILFASAAAALKATKHGGQEGIPGITAVERFLKANAARPSSPARLGRSQTGGRNHRRSQP